MLFLFASIRCRFLFVVVVVVVVRAENGNAHEQQGSISDETISAVNITDRALGLRNYRCLLFFVESEKASVTYAVHRSMADFSLIEFPAMLF